MARCMLPIAANVVCTLLMLAAPAFALSPPPLSVSKPARAVMLPPRLTVQGAELPVRLESVSITTQVAGRLAHTSVELVFFNPNGRQLEGELQFPLLDGQEVTSFAMDFDGKLREAVPVEKSRGQAVFEDITRARVDPALAEKTIGNNFKLRVYPLFARAKKIVVVRYQEALPERAGALIYRLPLAYGERIARLQWAGYVAAAAAPRHARGPLGDVKIVRAASGFDLFAARLDVQSEGVVELAIPASSAALAATQDWDGETYFYAEPRVAPATAARAALRAAPARVALYWDASGSGAQRDHAREFDALGAYFTRYPNMLVSLLMFRDVPEAPRQFNVNKGDWSALRRALEAAVYDGASHFAPLAQVTGVDEVLLFSDGLANYGNTAVPACAVPVYAISAAARSDAGYLRALAEQSGGRYADALKLGGQAAAALLTERAARISIASSQGVADVLLASPYAENGRVQLAGRLTEAAGSVVLRIEAGQAKPAFVTVPIQRSSGEHTASAAAASNSALTRTGHAPRRAEPLQLSGPQDGAPQGGFAAQRWGALKAAALEADVELNRAQIERIGKRFRLITRSTSLIILDNARDYARYDIEPPAELRAEFERLRATAIRTRDADRNSHLERVVQQFRDKQAWWDREFPKGSKPVPVAEKKEQSPSAVVAGALGGPPPVQAMEARPSAASVRNAPPPAPMLPTMPAAKPAAPPPPPPAPAAAPAPAPAVPSAAARMAPQGATGFQAQAPGIGDDVARTRVGARGDGAAVQASIRLQPWSPDAPYARRLREADASNLYRIYLDERASYQNSTAFFLDVADLLFAKKEPALALRVLSNLAEMNLENRHILRILGYRLMQAGEAVAAVPVFKRVRELSPEEPQSHRDLGLAYAAAGAAQRAIDALAEVVTRPWHGRFPGVELIALAELNAIAAQHSTRLGAAQQPSGPAQNAPLDLSRLDPRLLRNLPLDLRAVLTWDADNTDIDLHVTDPNGDTAYYSNPLTYQGGRMSADFTGGYGPEEFALKTAKPGKYRIEAEFFGQQQQVVSGATTLMLKLTTGFGTLAAREQLVTLRLKDARARVFVGEFEVGGR